MDDKEQDFRSLESLKDKYIGLPGSHERDKYEFELQLDIIGDIIKSVRKKRNLTQQELGQLIGVRKSEISKLEKNARNMTIKTIVKVFDALKAKLTIKIELDNEEFSLR